jgi:hypothetical protein
MISAVLLVFIAIEQFRKSRQVQEPDQREV